MHRIPYSTSRRRASPRAASTPRERDSGLESGLRLGEAVGAHEAPLDPSCMFGHTRHKYVRVAVDLGKGANDQALDDWATGPIPAVSMLGSRVVDRKYLEPPPTITPSRALQKSRKIGRSGLCCRNSTSAWPSNRWLAVYAGSGRNPPFVGVDARGPLLLPALPPRLSS